MTDRPAHVVAAALLALALAACSKADGEGAGGAAGDDAVVAAWKQAGLEVSALTDADAKTYAAESCKSGTVSGVDVVLCKYDTGEDAKAAEDPALATVSGITGAAIAKGARLLVVADRRKADPTGRTVNAITKTFRK